MKMKNVLLIVVDDLRQDRFISCANGFVKDAIKNGAYFSKAMTTAVHTSPSFASILTGTYPFQHKIYSLYGYKLSKNVTTLPEVLSRNGYSTMAFVSGPLSKDIELFRGFDIYNYRENTQLITGSVQENIIKTIKGAKEPWFAMIHIWGLHDRFTGSTRELRKIKLAARKHAIYTFLRNATERLGIREAVKKIIRKKPVVVRDNDEEDEKAYSDSVRYHNDVLETLAKKISPDLLIITGDHGERLREENTGIKRMKMVNGRHGFHVHDYLLNVPLLISGEGIRTRHHDKAVRTLDIFPTILDYLGIEYGGKVHGESLLRDCLEDRTILCGARGTCLKDDEWIECIRTGRYKYYYRPFKKNQEETLIDLLKDPHEKRNVIDQNREIANDLRKRMDAMKSDEDLSVEQTLDVNEEMKERLRALGYI